MKDNRCKDCSHSSRIKNSNNTFSKYWLKCDMLIDSEEQITRPYYSCFAFHPKEGSA